MPEPPERDKWIHQREALIPELSKLLDDKQAPLEAGIPVHLVLDNASWHKSKRLIWHHIEPIYLPPYSLDFNPIEKIWQYLKGHGMAGYTI